MLHMQYRAQSRFPIAALHHTLLYNTHNDPDKHDKLHLHISHPQYIHISGNVTQETVTQTLTMHPLL